jgi:hypothetical protein
MIVGNKIICLTNEQLKELVPIYYKDRYWLQSVDENEDIVYTQITWEGLISNKSYRLLNGKSPVSKGFTHVKLHVTELDEIALNNDGYHIIENEL